MDGRKNNGGHSTKALKKTDRRKRDIMSDDITIDAFFDNMKSDLHVLHKSLFKTFLDKHIKHGKHYVYFHYLNNEVVYIGKGKGERLFSHNRTDEEHAELVKKGSITEVVICNNLDEDIALLIEGALISVMKPIFNSKY